VDGCAQQGNNRLIGASGLVGVDQRQTEALRQPIRSQAVEHIGDRRRQHGAHLRGRQLKPAQRRRLLSGHPAGQRTMNAFPGNDELLLETLKHLLESFQRRFLGLEILHSRRYSKPDYKYEKHARTPTKRFKKEERYRHNAHDPNQDNLCSHRKLFFRFLFYLVSNRSVPELRRGILVLSLIAQAFGKPAQAQVAHSQHITARFQREWAAALCALPIAPITVFQISKAMRTFHSCASLQYAGKPTQ
jgi:hypothetical protein